MEFIASRDPATSEEMTKTESFDPSQMTDLVSRARVAQQSWRRLSFRERSAFLIRGQKYVLAHMDEIAQAISKNNGKPLVEALSAEVVATIQTFSFAINEASRVLKKESVSLGRAWPTKAAYITYRPLGVVGIISPWNYPLSTPIAEIILGLAAGNAIIIKPSEVTGLVNEQIQKIVDHMGLPADVFTMVHGRGDVGAALASSKVNKIIFTGSTSTGRKIMGAAAQNLTPVTLELGGKDSMIILDDADIDIASSAAVVGGFYNAGQTCCSIERLLVHEKISDEFLTLFKKKLATLRMGPSTSFNNDLGPVTFEGQKSVYAQQSKDHQANNGVSLFGEASYDGHSSFMKPLVVKADERRKFWTDETFGPVVAVKTFKTDSDAIKINNENPYGLTAVIWTGHTSRARSMAPFLNVGTVVINDAPFTNAVSALPWGGVGESGFGWVHGAVGLKELSQAQVITYDRLGQIRQIWWYPYSQAQYDFFKSAVVFLNGFGFLARVKGFFGAIKNYIKMGSRI